MGTLGEATDFLLRCSTPADWIELADGWVHDKRPDRPSTLYLCFPGN